MQLHVAPSGDAPPTSPCCCMQLGMHKEKHFSTTVHAQMFALILLEVWSGKSRADCSPCSLLQELDYFDLLHLTEKLQKLQNAPLPTWQLDWKTSWLVLLLIFFQNITSKRQILPWFLPQKLNFCAPLCQAKGPAQTHPRNRAPPSAFVSDCWMEQNQPRCEPWPRNFCSEARNEAESGKL